MASSYDWEDEVVSSTGRPQSGRQWQNILTSQMIPQAVQPKDTIGQACDETSPAAASSTQLLRSVRCIAAVDMDCFYAQCEELRNPELRGKPVGVQQKMLVITSNYAARACGIAKGDSLRTVKEKCPDITICNGEDLTFYGEVSQRVFDLAARWTTKVEKLGLDEVFLDLTDLVEERLTAEAQASDCFDSVGCVYPGPEDEQEMQAEEPEFRGECWRRLCVASRICAELRRAILDEVGLTSSAGVSVSKQMAKMVSSWKKPDQQTLFLPTALRLQHLLPARLPVQKIPGIGFSSTQKCQEVGVRTIGELVEASDEVGSGKRSSPLSKVFDERTISTMRGLCLGIDPSDVKTSGPPKSCSVEDSFWQAPLRSDADVREALRALAQKLICKVRSDEKRFGFRPLPTMAVCVRLVAPEDDPKAIPHSRRERRQMHLAGFRLAGGPGGQQAVTSEGNVDESKIRQISEKAFGLFRKMVPKEPFALNILNLQVQFDDALPSTQRRLDFGRPAAPQTPMPASAVEEHELVECVDDAEVEVEATIPTAAPAAALAELVAMGFAEQEAAAALASAGSRGLQAAVDLLLEHPRRAAPEAATQGVGVRKRPRCPSVEEVQGVPIVLD